ncbi:hypothetical protein PanWU01x14_301090 [Parasponia andersonii]|uniref:Uncharacterized protein n=1 Tax=Parasponia andersonii TaxID=3476 RepID=A0A2P5AU14_PARAD|nr:hypothetical protein PanWU01x14_301090 [Parasponia andersonii]
MSLVLLLLTFFRDMELMCRMKIVAAVDMECGYGEVESNKELGILKAWRLYSWESGLKGRPVTR